MHRARYEPCRNAYRAYKMIHPINAPHQKEDKTPMSAFKASREIPATVEQVFAAFSDPERLSRWWGPAGFTNTFTTCEFNPGGRWSFTMHGPDGKNYRNECLFAEID